MSNYLYIIIIPVAVFLIWLFAQGFGWGIIHFFTYFNLPLWSLRFTGDVMKVLGIILICIAVVLIFKDYK